MPRIITSAFALCLASVAHAQCVTQLQPFGGGSSNAVRVLATLRDGSLFAGGNFQQIGTLTTANGVARRVNGVWTPLGNFPPIGAECVVELPNGNLVVGGVQVAQWNGSVWTSMGTGVARYPGTGFPYVNAVAAMPNGDVVVGGVFEFAGGVPVNNIARWDGTAWHPLSNLALNPVSSLLVLPNGDLIAGFANLGVARWNGTYWSNLGIASGNYTGVAALALLPGGDLVVGGSFTAAGGVSVQNVARWDGVNWAAMGGGLPFYVKSLLPLPNGEILAVCTGNFANQVWRFRNGGWVAEPGVVISSPSYRNSCSAAVAPNGDVYLAGDRFDVGGAFVAYYLTALVPTCRAASTTVPSACVRPSGPLTLRAAVLPWTGGVASTECSTLGASSVAVAVTGLAPGNMPLSLLDPSAGANCSLLVRADVVEFAPMVAGVARAQLAIPADPTLAGVIVQQQMVEGVFGPVGLSGLYASPALQLTVGVL